MINIISEIVKLLEESIGTTLFFLLGSTLIDISLTVVLVGLFFFICLLRQEQQKHK